MIKIFLLIIDERKLNMNILRSLDMVKFLINLQYANEHILE